MNDNNRYYDQNEVKNKLHNFQEGKDYFVTPSKEPEVKDYTFYNDHLKSFFGGVNWVPVRVQQEKYDDEKFSYRGHFEEGKLGNNGGSYSYSYQSWTGMPPADENGWRPISKSFQSWGNGDWRKTSARFRSLENNHEPKRIEPNRDLKWKHSQLSEKLSSLLNRPESEFGVNGKWKKEAEIAEVKKDIVVIEREIEKEKNLTHDSLAIKAGGCCNCGKIVNRDADAVWYKRGRMGDYLMCSSDCKEEFVRTYKGDNKHPRGRVVKSGSEEYSNENIQQKGRRGRNEEGSWASDNNSGLEQENSELRQQLAQVQAELAKVLAELKKLGQSNPKLEQQQSENERAISAGSVAEVKKQVQKSEALVQELKTPQVKKNEEKQPHNDSHPYLVGGSLLAVGLGVVGVGAWCWKKRRQK